MESFISAAAVLLPLAYLGLVVTYADLFLEGRSLTRRLAMPLLAGALALHLAYLVALAFRWHQLPVATVPQALSAVALAVAVVYALVEWIGEERSTGVWLIALVFLLQLLASLLEKAEPPELHLFRSPLFASHIALALLGYAAFVVSGAYGFVFLRLYRELKSGELGLFYGKLPPLEVLERMMSGALIAGFAALTGAVLAGSGWAFQIGYEGWGSDPRVLSTFLVWALYACALLMRKLQRWQGRQTAIASLAGLAALVVSLVAFNFVFRGFHGNW